MSYVTTIRLVTAVGEGHDEVVKMWRDNLSSCLNNVQVSTIHFVRISQLLKDITTGVRSITKSIRIQWFFRRGEYIQ